MIRLLRVRGMPRTFVDRIVGRPKAHVDCLSVSRHLHGRRNLLTRSTGECRSGVCHHRPVLVCRSPGPISKQLALHAELSFLLPCSWPKPPAPLRLTSSRMDIFRQRIQMFLKCFASRLPAIALDLHCGWSRKVTDEFAFQAEDVGLF